MLTTPELLANLERSLVVEAEQLAKLRRMYEKSPNEVTPKAAMKWLVDQGQLTAQQAERLLASATQSSTPAAPAPAAQAKPKNDDDDLLGLAPLEDDPAPRKVAAKPAPTASKPVEPVRKPEPAKTQAATPKPSPKPAAPKAPATPQSTPVAPAAVKGPLDDMFDDPSFGKPLGGPLGTPLTPSKRGGKKNVWDSPLLLIGGGALLLLCIVGVVLMFSLGRQTGDQAFQAAEGDYAAGSYSQAIHKYDQYLEKYPSHSSVSIARVHRGLAKLRQAVDASNDWSQSLATAKQILGQIATEDSFAQAGPDLGALLSAIAEGLAKLCNEQPDPARVEQAREALALVQKHVPTSQQPVLRLAEAENLIGLAVRKLDQGKVLDSTIASIRSLAAAGKAAEAYATYKQFLKTYPDTGSEGKKLLRDALVELSQVQKKAVRFVEEKRAATTTDAKTPIVATVTLAHRSGKDATDVAGETLAVLADGAAYGLDAATGKLLWRRFVGYDSTFTPQPAPGEPAGDVLLVDAARNELVRIAAKTGQLRWRVEIGEPFAPPAVLRQNVIIATSSGKLIKIDAASGSSDGHIHLPQAVAVRPSVDSRERLYYQPADHSNLFVVTADGACQEVFYLGHETGRIRVAPVTVGRYVLVAENRGATDGVLHVLKTDDNGLGLASAQTIPYQGHVVVAPEVAGRSVFLATDRGMILVFEVSVSDQGTPLVKVTEKPVDPEPTLIRYLLVRNGRLWVAGAGLSRYDVQTARGRLAPSWTRQDRDISLADAQLVGQKTLVSIRRRQGLPGVAVAALRADDGQALWETQLAAPLAGVAQLDPAAKKLLAVTSLGDVFTIDAAQLAGASALDAPVATLAGSPALAPVAAPLPNGGTAVAASAPSEANLKQQVAVLDKTSGSDAPKIHWLPLTDVMAAPPVPLRNGLLVPGQIGQVFHLDPSSGETLIEPFQPKLESGVKYAWSRPVNLDDKEVLIADGRTKLYRLGVDDKPKPHLVALSEATVAAPIVSSVAVVGKTAYAADASGKLLSFSLPDLAPSKDWPLEGGAVWGPERVGDRVLVTTHNKLFCFDDSPKVIWEMPLEHGALAGVITSTGGDFVAASKSGVIYAIATDSGKAGKAIEVGQPLSAAPSAWGNQWLIITADGAIHIIDQ